MPGKRKARVEPIPEQFSSIEAAGQFWDEHDLGDYWDQSRPINDLSFCIKRRQHLVALRPALAQRLRKAAYHQGLTSEQLANRWLGEKLRAFGGQR